MFKEKLQEFFHTRCSGEAWFESITLLEEGKKLRVSFPHAFFATWFTLNKKSLFEEGVERCCPSGTQILYENLPKSASEETAKKLPRSLSVSPKKELNASLERFLYNKKNAFTYTTIANIAEHKPGELYPLVILTGSSGCGKTYLLEALAKKLLAKNLNILVALHVDELWKMLSRQRDPVVFWSRYKAILVDDIQNLSENSDLQQKLTQYIDSCPQKRQFVFTSSRSPSSLSDIDEKLRNRLLNGLTLELLEPDLDVRLRYVQVQCAEQQIRLERRQMLFVAQHCLQFRKIHGILLKIHALTHLQKHRITSMELENLVLEGSLEKEIDAQKIIQQVARTLRVPLDELLGQRRHSKSVLARQMAMYLCRERLGLSYPKLGRIFGGKDHSTVIHAINKIELLLTQEKHVNDLLTQVNEALIRARKRSEQPNEQVMSDLNE